MSKKIGAKTETEQAIDKCESLIERLSKMRNVLMEESVIEILSKSKSFVENWTHTIRGRDAIRFDHPSGDVVSILKNQAKGGYEVRHNGGANGIWQFDTPKEALTHAREYMTHLNTNVLPRKQLAGRRLSKTYTPAQKAAMEEAEHLKKTFDTQKWLRHSDIGNVEAKIAEMRNVKRGENVLANQLANMMSNKNMLGQKHSQPSSEEMIAAGEGMGIGSNPELVKAAEGQWHENINSWLKEASKPIASKFSSTEEEEAYWASIKVMDNDDGRSGY